MNLWLIAIIIGILAITGFVTANIMTNTSVSSEVTQKTCGCGSSGGCGCGGKCTAENNCGLSSCGVATGKTCGCSNK